MHESQTKKVISLDRIKAACKNCSLQELCLPVGLNGDDITALDKLIKRRRALKKGEMLYRSGDRLHSLYAIRRGTFKTVGLIQDGRAQVTGFHLPGELLGIDAINTDRHPCSAEALEAAEVCDIPFAALEELASHVPGLQHQLLRIMSREIERDEAMLMLLGRMNAEERLASCLMSLSRRLERLGAAPSDFRLSMSRQDLGDYLGLALETVSRLLSRFHEQGLIHVRGRHIILRDRERLRALAVESGCGRSASA